MTREQHVQEYLSEHACTRKDTHSSNDPSSQEYKKKLQAEKAKIVKTPRRLPLCREPWDSQIPGLETLLYPNGMSDETP